METGTPSDPFEGLIHNTYPLIGSGSWHIPGVAVSVGNGVMVGVSTGIGVADDSGVKVAVDVGVGVSGI